jgi:hypothetical protein
MGPGALPIAERLLDWLRAFEDDEVSGSVIGILETLISWSRRDPSLDVYAELWWWCAYGIFCATEDAPFEILLERHIVLFPFLMRKIRPRQPPPSPPEESKDKGPRVAVV